ncbi:RNA polymerase sigma factor [Maioricimonas rarisocia]|uniref:RNA polymerase sigma factor n=2 Tax=Maioricimonas rarisocia TaxID=2528026 RepID=A0A517ZAU1_9PLAN|nr:RNA polymerase sigma factor [Maioricimonas rarisocia]
MKTLGGDSSTSITLIDRARQFESEAWNRLCYIYGPLVYRWARLVGLQDSDAADIAQDVFLTVSRRIESFDHSRPGASFRGWLKVITRNKIGDWLREQQAVAVANGGSTAHELLYRVPELWDDEPSSDAVADQERGVLLRTLEMIRTEFEPTTWQAFWESTAEERPTDEIAERLGMTRHAVRQAKYRVLRRLRSEIGGETNGTELL